MTLTQLPVWLDCDPGHDDAIAIVLAALHPAYNLLGISTVHGNASLENTTSNALRILTALGDRGTHIKVYTGASRPLVKPPFHAPEIHGSFGLNGSTLLPESVLAPQTTDSIDAIYDAAVKYNGELCLLATGTLTNVAALYKKYPDVKEKLRILSIMGGAIHTGNSTKWAEFNIYCDPHSAKIVLTDSMMAPKTIMIPLDLTHQAIATKSVRQSILYGPKSIKGTTTVLRKLIFELLEFFSETNSMAQGFNDGPPVHDPVAVAALLPICHLPIGKELDFKYTRYNIDVVLEGEQEGRTVVLEPSDIGVYVGESMNVPYFWSLLLDALEMGDHTNSIVSKSNN